MPRELLRTERRSAPRPLWLPRCCQVPPETKPSLHQRRGQPDCPARSARPRSHQAQSGRHRRTPRRQRLGRLMACKVAHHPSRLRLSRRRPACPSSYGQALRKAEALRRAEVPSYRRLSQVRRLVLAPLPICRGRTHPRWGPLRDPGTALHSRCRPMPCRAAVILCQRRPGAPAWLGTPWLSAARVTHPLGRLGRRPGQVRRPNRADRSLRRCRSHQGSEVQA